MNLKYNDSIKMIWTGKMLILLFLSILPLFLSSASPDTISMVNIELVFSGSLNSDQVYHFGVSQIYSKSLPIFSDSFHKYLLVIQERDFEVRRKQCENTRLWFNCIRPLAYWILIHTYSVYPEEDLSLN